MRAAVLQYETRAPEQTLLYGVVASELETFLARQRSAEHEVPRFVEREFRAFLECGVLSHGFLRVHCGSCGMDRVVGFSCKKRGWCPSGFVHSLEDGPPFRRFRDLRAAAPYEPSFFFSGSGARICFAASGIVSSNSP